MDGRYQRSRPSKLNCLRVSIFELAYKNSYNCFVSHRSGETVDSFISDLTVAVNAGHLKTGSGCRGERIEKFNQLMRIEHALGSASEFAGKKAFKNA